jgi:hypothetical protein
MFIGSPTLFNPTRKLDVALTVKLSLDTPLSKVPETKTTCFALDPKMLLE